jgi:hypothetical protein
MAMQRAEIAGILKSGAAAGTDLAPLPDSDRGAPLDPPLAPSVPLNARTPRRSRRTPWTFAAALLFSLAVSSCLVPAPVPEAVPDAKPWITIRKDKADPQLPGAWVWDVKTNQVKPFELGIVEFGNLRGPLRYSWYYDPPPTTPVLDSFKVCGSSAKCSLELCKKLNNTLADHVVLVVVSDGPLKADAKGPYEFPDGTTFDSVEWHIKKVGNCP